MCIFIDFCDVCLYIILKIRFSFINARSLCKLKIIEWWCTYRMHHHQVSGWWFVSALFMEVYKVVLSSSTLTEIYRIKQYLKILIDVWVSATQVFIMMINQVSNDCILLQDVFLFVVWEIEQPITSLMSQIKFNLIFVSIATWNTVEMSFMWETIRT